MKKLLFLFAVSTFIFIGSINTASACPGMSKGKPACAKCAQSEKKVCTKCKAGKKACGKCAKAKAKKKPCLVCAQSERKAKGNPTGIYLND